MKHQFILHEIRNSESLGSDIHVYNHTSGAQLVWFKNNDQHKTFGIGFKTIPTSSNGVAHIVEHCVLNGSRKYLVKEPFMELVKTSLQTFLNAMTYSDMTLYPVSTMDNQDFMNLMNVYMDAVFFPRMLEKPEIFYQEGWHYQLKDKADDLTISGVVYNEMKGAYGSVDRAIYSQVLENLYPNSTYSVDSGGDPQVIPSLTYEQFKAFHQAHYHPSNALIYLYGDLDIETILTVLDQEYLSYFEQKDLKHDVVCNQQLQGIIKKEFSFNHDDENGNILTYTLPLGLRDTAYKRVFMTLMSHILFESNSAVVRLALMDKDLGDDLITFASDTLSNEFGVGIKNVDVSRVDEFVDTIQIAFKDIVKNGLNHDLVLSIINQFEISLRVAGGSKKGLLYFINVMNSFRYNQDLLSDLELDAIFKQIYRDLDEGVFEKFIQDNLIDPQNVLIGIHKPDLTLFKCQEAELKVKLANYKNTLNDVELDEIIKLNQRLEAFQKQQDSVEEKNTLPHLSLKDIKAQVNQIDTIEEEINGAKIFKHPAATNQMNYVQLSFKVYPKTMDEVHLLGLYSLLVGKVNTNHRSYVQLGIDINLHGSSINVSPNVYGKHVNEYYTMALNVSTSSIGDKIQYSLNDVFEILFESQFDDLKRIRELISQEILAFESSIEYRGHSFVLNRIRAMGCSGALVLDHLDGLGFYDYLVELNQNLDESLVSKLTDVKQMLSRNELIVSLTSDHFNGLDEVVVQLVEKIPNHLVEPELFLPDLVEVREAIIIPSNVNYVSKGGYFKNEKSFDGSLFVLSNILSNDYLYNQVRAQNGAYGVGINFSTLGSVATYSYRDPQIGKTVETYQNLGNVLEQLDMSEADLEQSIIGSLSWFISPLSAFELNSFYLNRYYSEISTKQIDLWYQQAKATTLEKLREFSKVLTYTMNSKALSVLGCESSINDYGQFDVIRTLKNN